MEGTPTQIQANELNTHPLACHMSNCKAVLTATNWVMTSRRLKKTIWIKVHSRYKVHVAQLFNVHKISQVLSLFFAIFSLFHSD